MTEQPEAVQPSKPKESTNASNHLDSSPPSLLLREIEGRDAGVERFATWDDADAFRESWTSGAGVHPQGYSAPPFAPGHKRSGVISKAEGK